MDDEFVIREIVRYELVFIQRRYSRIAPATASGDRAFEGDFL